jgi:hypothetical protein
MQSLQLTENPVARFSVRMLREELQHIHLSQETQLPDLLLNIRETNVVWHEYLLQFLY